MFDRYSIPPIQDPRWFFVGFLFGLLLCLCLLLSSCGGQSHSDAFLVPDWIDRPFFYYLIRTEEYQTSHGVVTLYVYRVVHEYDPSQNRTMSSPVDLSTLPDRM